MDANTKRVQSIVREQGWCGELTRNGTHVCILAPGHAPTDDCKGLTPPVTASEAHTRGMPVLGAAGRGISSSSPPSDAASVEESVTDASTKLARFKLHEAIADRRKYADGFAAVALGLSIENVEKIAYERGRQSVEAQIAALTKERDRQREDYKKLELVALQRTDEIAMIREQFRTKEIAHDYWQGRAEAAEAERDRLQITRKRALAAVQQIERHCPCGARPETINTHHHVAGCPVEAALVYLSDHPNGTSDGTLIGDGSKTTCNSE